MDKTEALVIAKVVGYMLSDEDRERLDPVLGDVQAIISEAYDRKMELVDEFYKKLIKASDYTYQYVDLVEVKKIYKELKERESERRF